MPTPAIPRHWRLTRSRTLIGVGLGLCYLLVLVVPHLLPHSGPFGRTFNSMLDHLLQGRFDVDPAVVGMEGFARDGRVYAYWGVVPALLRLPVTWVPGWRDLDYTIPYCAVALIWLLAVKLWTVRFIVRHRREVPGPLARAMYAAIALSGAQTCFLRFSLYQEVCLWAGLFAAIFVAAAIVAQHSGLGRRERMVLALAAGAALLTRVSTGIGLIAAFSLLLLVELIVNRADWRAEVRRSIPSLLVLGAIGGAAAWINYGRWADPLTFADYKYYLFNIKYPDRIARTAAYGLFNIARIPFGLIYYFVPVWVLPGGDGQLLFAAARFRLIDSAELPPSSFFLTDALLLTLGGVALWRWRGVRGMEGARGGAVAAGLAIPPLLMLTAISMCFRYRMDFYPLIEFLAFSGFALIRRGDVVARSGVAWPLAGVSIASSLLVSIAYLTSKLGPGQLQIAQGVGHYYLTRLGLR